MSVAAVAVAVLLSTVAGAGGAGVQDPAAILPADGFATGWARVDTLRRYRGAELYGHIDGGAEVFLELGFEQAVVQDYAAGEDELTVEVYLMRDEIAAAGVYLLKSGDEARNPEIPGRHSFDPRQVLLYRGQVYVVLYNTSGGSAATAAMVLASRRIAELLPAGSLPLLELLPAEGRVEGSTRVARGPFTLQKVFTLGEGDVLSLGGVVPAVAADYHDGHGQTFTRIVVRYPDGAAAKSAFEHLSASLDPAITVLSRESARLTFRDWAGKLGDAVLSDASIQVRVNLPAAP